MNYCNTSFACSFHGNLTCAVKRYPASTALYSQNLREHSESTSSPFCTSTVTKYSPWNYVLHDGNHYTLIVNNNFTNKSLTDRFCADKFIVHNRWNIELAIHLFLWNFCIVDNLMRVYEWTRISFAGLQLAGITVAHQMSSSRLHGNFACPR